MIVLVYIFLMLFAFAVLAKICDKYFVQSLEIISKKMKLTDDVAGATFMAIWSSAPEFFTAAIAMMTVGSEVVWAGTIVWSALFNLLVIVGWSAVVMKHTAWKLKKAPLIRDLMFYVRALVMLYVTFADGTITLMETGLYLISYIVYIVILSQRSKRYAHHRVSIAQAVEEEQERFEKNTGVLWRVMAHIDHFIDRFFPNLDKKPQLARVSFGLSITRIIALSRLLVESGVGFAHEVGIPEVVIGLTILAAGTSIPDLLASLIVSKKGQIDMAVSNAVGSNIFDVFVCLWLPRCLYILFTWQEVTMSTQGLDTAILLLLGSVIVLLALLIGSKFAMKKRIGLLLIAIYVGYVIYQLLVI